MPFIVKIEDHLKKHDMSLTDLAKYLDLTVANVANLKNGHAKALRVTTLNRLCKLFKCQLNDLFEYRDEVESYIVMK